MSRGRDFGFALTCKANALCTAFDGVGAFQRHGSYLLGLRAAGCHSQSSGSWQQGRPLQSMARCCINCQLFVPGARYCVVGVGVGVGIGCGEVVNKNLTTQAHNDERS